MLSESALMSLTELPPVTARSVASGGNHTPVSCQELVHMADSRSQAVKKMCH